ncbi:bifunctional enoyl-CoA hydratase/phosphate acetyltransferase [Photobacterium sagamiensis]|uniref:bifunctional enoyl-CoA hydratase/phosphate acetyltransferase n=1 Tax=Photobacterium sagamiensis TaxID=2910241 RepID=UPI003D108DEF
MTNVERFLNQVRQSSLGTKRLVVVAPHDEATLLAVEHARKEQLIEATLVGEEEKIVAAAEKAGVCLMPYDVVATYGDPAAADCAVRLIADGKGQALMKGLIDTSILLKALLTKEYGLRTGRLFSHVALLLPPQDHGYYLLTDAGMNISPSLHDKQQIIENAVDLAHALGNNNPNVALLCAKEKAYDKMPATLDAVELQARNLAGDITGCTVSGPLQLDLAVSAQAAMMKDCQDPVAGNVDIFVAPTIEVGNVFGKALKYMGGYVYAGVVLGAKIPVVLVSRADSEQEKLLSIAMACVCTASEPMEAGRMMPEMESA